MVAMPKRAPRPAVKRLPRPAQQPLKRTLPSRFSRKASTAPYSHPDALLPEAPAAQLRRAYPAFFRTRTAFPHRTIPALPHAPPRRSPGSTGGAVAPHLPGIFSNSHRLPAQNHSGSPALFPRHSPPIAGDFLHLFGPRRGCGTVAISAEIVYYLSMKISAAGGMRRAFFDGAAI